MQRFLFGPSLKFLERLSDESNVDDWTMICHSKMNYFSIINSLETPRSQSVSLVMSLTQLEEGVDFFLLPAAVVSS